MAKAKRRAKLKSGTRASRVPPAAVTLYQPSWDVGPNTPAQRAGKIIEDAKIWDAEKEQWVNPNGVRRARRIDLIEAWANQGTVTPRQLKAAMAIRFAWERTMKSPPAIQKVLVDTCPKPDAHIAIIVDRISAYVDLMAMIPPASRGVVTCVVLDGHGVNQAGYKGSAYARGMDLLRDGLDVVADRLGM